MSIYAVRDIFRRLFITEYRRLDSLPQRSVLGYIKQSAGWRFSSVNVLPQTRLIAMLRELVLHFDLSIFLFKIGDVLPNQIENFSVAGSTVELGDIVQFIMQTGVDANSKMLFSFHMNPSIRIRKNDI
jgi:hypothetical protein